MELSLIHIWCYVPNQISLGGITGLGQIINAAVPAIPIGIAVIVLNIPLFLLSWKYLGGRLLLSSLFAMAATSLGVDIVAAIHSFQPMDPMLASVFGGVLIGLSLGIILLQGATTGGTDLIARLLKLPFGHLPMGRLLMAVDLAVIAAVALAFRSLNSALYGIISLYLSTVVIDKVLYGDVYKRQTFRWKPDLEVFTDINVPVDYYLDTMKRQAVVNAGAVSYTHLDVYKRQEIA